MRQFAVVTDSTSTIPDDLVAQYGIKVAPQILIFGEESLRDGVDISAAQFYTRLKESEVHPTTSQVTVATFHSIFEPLAREGVPILAILVSSKVSGTILSAEQAKAMIPGARIEVVDSCSVGMGLGFQVLAAARAAETGKSFEEAAALAHNASDHVGVLFFVDSLEYLHRGGRIGGATRFLGTALNIKPLLEVMGGRVEPLERVRTKKKALARLLEVFKDRVADQDMVRLAALHAAAEEDAHTLLHEAEKLCKPVESFVVPVSPTIGAHSGPGTVGLVYSVRL